MQGLIGMPGDRGGKGVPGNACQLYEEEECENVVFDGEPGMPGNPGRDGWSGAPGSPVSNYYKWN